MRTDAHIVFVQMLLTAPGRMPRTIRDARANDHKDSPGSFRGSPPTGRSQQGGVKISALLHRWDDFSSDGSTEERTQDRVVGLGMRSAVIFLGGGRSVAKAEEYLQPGERENDSRIDFG